MIWSFANCGSIWTSVLQWNPRSHAANQGNSQVSGIAMTSLQKTCRHSWLRPFLRSAGGVGERIRVGCVAEFRKAQEDRQCRTRREGAPVECGGLRPSASRVDGGESSVDDVCVESVFDVRGARRPAEEACAVRFVFREDDLVRLVAVERVPSEFPVLGEDDVRGAEPE